MLGRLWNKLLMCLACAMPDALAYWVTVRVMTSATSGKYRDTPTSRLRMVDALACWREVKAERGRVIPLPTNADELERIAAPLRPGPSAPLLMTVGGAGSDHLIPRDVAGLDTLAADVDPLDAE